MSQENNPFFAAQSEAGDFETLEPGSYNGVCIGVVIREFPNFNDKSVMDEKVQFVFQIVEGGQQYYLRSKPCKLVINDRSNLYLLINSWTKATLERMTDGFSCDKMVGFGAQIVVNNREYNGKTYADIANILPLKKGVKVPVTTAEIPAFLAKGAVAQLWAPGITVKPEEAPKAATFPAGVPGGLGSAVPAATGKKAPKMPANANVTQNTDAAAFMGVPNPDAFVGQAQNTLKVANPASQPAGPDVVTGEQAIAQEGLTEESDDSDLPF